MDNCLGPLARHVAPDRKLVFVGREPAVGCCRQVFIGRIVNFSVKDDVQVELKELWAENTWLVLRPPFEPDIEIARAGFAIVQAIELLKDSVAQ